MFNSILVATDGSKPAEKAVSIAADLAAKYDSRITILHTRMHGGAPRGFEKMVQVEHMVESHPHVPEPSNMSSGLAETLSDIDAGIDGHRYYEIVGERILNESKAVVKKRGVKDIATVVTDGNAAEQILVYANNKKVDLIVMGTRGLGELKGLLMGNVSHKVGQLANCPCLTVK